MLRKKKVRIAVVLVSFVAMPASLTHTVNMLIYTKFVLCMFNIVELFRVFYLSVCPNSKMAQRPTEDAGQLGSFSITIFCVYWTLPSPIVLPQRSFQVDKLKIKAMVIQLTDQLNNESIKIITVSQNKVALY